MLGDAAPRPPLPDPCRACCGRPLRRHVGTATRLIGGAKPMSGPDARVLWPAAASLTCVLPSADAPPQLLGASARPRLLEPQDFRGRGEAKAKATGRERQTGAGPRNSSGRLGTPENLESLGLRKVWPLWAFWTSGRRGEGCCPHLVPVFHSALCPALSLCALPRVPRCPKDAPRVSRRRVVHRGYPHCW